MHQLRDAELYYMPHTEVAFAERYVSYVSLRRAAPRRSAWHRVWRMF